MVVLKLYKVEKNLPFHCFINDVDSNNIAKMKEKTKDYSDFIVEYENKDANSYYKEVLQKMPLEEFRIFFLDPCNHKHLKWATIEGISKHTYNFKVRIYGDQIRRPEIIINLMTYTMLQDYRAKNYKNISESLGTDEWKNKIKENQRLRIDAPIEKAFIQTFIEQLSKLGYKVTTPLPILGTTTNNLIYCLIWATNERGFQVIEQRLTSNLFKLLEQVQSDNEVNISKAKAKKDKIVPLNQFFQQ